MPTQQGSKCGSAEHSLQAVHANAQDRSKAQVLSSTACSLTFAFLESGAKHAACSAQDAQNSKKEPMPPHGVGPLPQQDL